MDSCIFILRDVLEIQQLNGHIVMLRSDLWQNRERIMNGEKSPTDLLEKTLARAKRDVATVKATGHSIASPLDGMNA